MSKQGNKSNPYNIKMVFDLDMTLYGKGDFKDVANKKLYYDSFKPKYFLHSILSMSPYQKCILTNGTKDHATEVVRRIGLSQVFPKNAVFSIDMAPSRVMKPDHLMYHLATKHFDIQPSDTVFYFEDLKENLQPVKLLYSNWKTIWICPEKDSIRSIPSYVDMTFVTIESALLHIYSILRTNKRTMTVPIVPIPSDTMPTISRITRVSTAPTKTSKDADETKKSLKK